MSPKALSLEYRGYTPAKAFQSNSPTIAHLIDEHGQEAVEIALNVHLAALSRFLNLKQGFTEEHIDFIVETLTTDYKWFKLADLSIIINRIKKSYYGEFYENFTAQKFLAIVAQYDQERTLEIERLRTEENRAHQTTTNPYQDKTLEQVAEMMNRATIAEKAKKTAAERTKEYRAITYKAIMEKAQQRAKNEDIPLDEAYNQVITEILTPKTTEQ